MATRPSVSGTLVGEVVRYQLPFVLDYGYRDMVPRAERNGVFARNVRKSSSE